MNDYSSSSMNEIIQEIPAPLAYMGGIYTKPSIFTNKVIPQYMDEPDYTGVNLDGKEVSKTKRTRKKGV